MSISVPRFRAYLEEFGLAETTLDKYASVAKRTLAAGGWIAELKTDLAPKTKRLVRAVARHWADFAADDKLRQSLKRLRLPAPRRQTAKVPLTRKDLFRVIDDVRADREIDPPARAAILLMAYRGFRTGDVLRMKRTEVVAALSQGVLAYEGKGRRRLEFTVLENFRQQLQVLADQPRWTRVDELISPAAGTATQRRAAASRRIQRTLARTGKRLGIEGLHPHRLRRTFSVEYLKANKGDPEAIMKLVEVMQWSGIATAMEYVNHARGAERDRVAETMFDR